LTFYVAQPSTEVRMQWAHIHDTSTDYCKTSSEKIKVERKKNQMSAVNTGAGNSHFITGKVEELNNILKISSLVADFFIFSN
jgi:alpha/beta superfamily hydrolase